MGVFIYWEAKEADSDYDQAEIHRSTSQNSGYSLIDTVSITDYTYFDEDGGENNYYKIRFKNSSSGKLSTFSDFIQGNETTIYTDPYYVVSLIGLDLSNLPGNLTVNKIYDFIWDTSRELDELTKSTYGQKTTISDAIYSTRYLDNGHEILNLEHRDIDSSTFKIELKQGKDSWRTLRDFYDYELRASEGKVLLYFWFPSIFTIRAYNDLKVNYDYGQSTIPEKIKQLTKIISAIRVITEITGGKYDSVSEYSLGPYSQSTRSTEKLTKTYNWLNEEKTRVANRFGINPDTSQDVRLA